MSTVRGKTRRCRTCGENEDGENVFNIVAGSKEIWDRIDTTITKIMRTGEEVERDVERITKEPKNIS